MRLDALILQASPPNPNPPNLANPATAAQANIGNGINKSTSPYLTGNSLLSPHTGKGEKKKPSVVEEPMSDRCSTCKNSKTNMEETSTCSKYNKPSDESTANLLIHSKEENVDHPASMLYTGSCLNAKSKVQLL